MKLKICGVRNQAMAQTCEEFGVDYVGFNFVPWSKRKIGPETAAELGEIFQGPKVGVFSDAEIPEIEKVLTICPLDILQLHGEESPEYIKKLKVKIPNIRLWKAFRLTDDFDPEMPKLYQDVHAFLFDGCTPGSGIPAKEKILRQTTKHAEENTRPFGIAGGITAENIFEIKTRFPAADFLDTASGVEKKNQFDISLFRSLLQNFHK